jgi:hypothetical protein
MYLRRSFGPGWHRLLPADEVTIRTWLARSWVAWRDGSMAASGGTGGSAINPATGAVETGPMTMDFLGLRFGFAWDEIVNKCSAMTIAPSGLASNTLVGMARTLTEDTSTGIHGVGSTAFALVDGTNYGAEVIVSRKAGSPSARHLALYPARGGGERAGVIINLDTGAAVGSAIAGGGSVSGITSRALGGGRFHIRWSLVNSAWGGTPSLYAVGTTSPTLLSTSYQGDGSGFVIEGMTLSPATDFAPLLAEGITRTADSFIWTTPAAVPQICEFTHLCLQPYASGDMGVAAQTWLENQSGTAQRMRIYRNDATSFYYADYDSGNKSDGASGVPPAAATLHIRRGIRTASSIEAGYGSAGSGSPTAGSSWTAWSAFYLGRAAAAGRASRAANTLIITPGGCTQYERDAQARMFHLRTVGLNA